MSTERIAELEAKLAASKNRPGYEERVAMIETELSALRGEPAQDGEPAGDSAASPDDNEVIDLGTFN